MRTVPSRGEGAFGMLKTEEAVPESATASAPVITLPADSLMVPPAISEVQTGYLAGQMLVATPVIDSGCFHKSVVYLFAQPVEGFTHIRGPGDQPDAGA